MNKENNKDNNSKNKNLKNNVVVKIGNTNYKLHTIESTKYVESLTKHINNKILEISSVHKNLNQNSPLFLLVLSLNITDDLFKQRQLFAKNSKAYEENKSAINSLKKELSNAKDVLLEKDDIIHNLKDNLKNNNEKVNDNRSLDKMENIILEKDAVIDSLNIAVKEQKELVDKLQKELFSANAKIIKAKEIELTRNVEMLELQEENLRLKQKPQNI